MSLSRHAINLLALLTMLSPLAARAQGMLMPTDQSLKPLGIKYQRVSAEIQDGTAVTKVEQVFVNDGPRQLEAHYVFPLPKGAALQDFYLWINGKKTKGEVLEKDKAANIYEGIVRRLQDPGLLEYIDSDVFRARVFPVPANGEQKIELTFSQVLEFQGGVYRYHYPLGASSKGAAPLKVRQDFTFSAAVNSKVPVRSIYSPTHALGISRKGEGSAVVGLELGAGADISKDLDLYYTVSDKAVGLSLLTHRPNSEEPGYFIALISPKNELKPEEVVGKRLTFVIDTSGSMMGERMTLAKKALEFCVTRLNARDEFNVVRFSTDVEALFEKPVAASPENVAKATAFVKSLEAIGGTAIDEAMLRGLKDGKGSEKPHLVLFITDGFPTVGDTEESVITAHAKAGNAGKSRVFTFGVGDDLNARLLDRLADDGSGTSDFARDGKEFETKVSGFFEKVSNPVLADLSLDLGAFAAFDVYPKKLGDLFKGQQLVVMGRYRTPADGAVTLKGTVNGAAKVFEYRAQAAKESKSQDFIPRLWAIRKVGYLLDEIRLKGERAELKDEVVMLGKKFGIVTPYTSYLVIEDTPMPVANRQSAPPPPPRMWREEEKRARPMDLDDGRPAPVMEPFAESGANTKSLGGFGKGGGQGVAPSAPKAAPMVSADALGKSDGTEGIAVARKVREMKDEQQGPAKNEPVRVANGRTFVYRSGGWMDTEALSAPGKQLTVKYLSDAYFALLKARPELKQALSLGSRVMVMVGPGKSVVVSASEGESAADKVTAFLK